MHMPPEILTRLLEGAHFDTSEREALGLLPTEVLRYAEVRDHLESLLVAREWFPARSSVAADGEPIHEGITIHRVSSKVFTCYVQRTSAIDPSVLAEKSSCKCRSAREAADYYLKWELDLPGRLDGWPVE